MYFKKRLVSSIVILALFFLVGVCSAESFTKDQIKVNIDGTKIDFSVDPVVSDGTTLVPIKQIFEALGAKIKWDDETKTVTATKEDTTIIYTLGKTTASRNGKSINLPVAGKIINGATLVPLRFVSEALEAEVGWRESDRVITILSKDKVKDNVFLTRIDADAFEITSHPTGEYWQSFVFKKESKKESNLNNWRIYDFSVMKSNQGTPLNQSWKTVNRSLLTVTGTQWEYAFKEPEESDHVGGFHGNELISEMQISIDNKQVVTDNGSSILSSIKVGETIATTDLQVKVISDIYRKASPTTRLAEVSRNYSFDQQGLNLNYKVEWKVSTLLDNSYVAMLPLKRDPEISTQAKYLDTAEVMDISSEGFKEIHQNVNGVEYWNKKNNLRIKMEVIDPEESLLNYKYNGYLKSWISNSTYYNKFYATIIGKEAKYKTKLGEVWNVKWRVGAYTNDK